MPCSPLLNSLFLSKIFIFKQKLVVKNLVTPTVKDFQICRFQYLLYIESAMSPNDRSPISIKKKKKSY